MMAYSFPSDSFYQPQSYANSIYGLPFQVRRPSPPPRTFISVDSTCDPYIRALAEEHAARSELANAIQRQQEAHRRRVEEEAARAQALTRAKARADAERAYRRRQRAMYGFPAAYPEYRYYVEDDDSDEDESCSPFEQYFTVPQQPVQRELPHARPQAPSMRQERSQPRARSPLNKAHGHQQNAPQTQSERVSIPIASYSGPSKEVQNDAASKIQSTYRAHSARKAAYIQMESIKSKFTSLRDGFTLPSVLDFEEDPHTYTYAQSRSQLIDNNDNKEIEVEEPRPKLAYSTRNAPVHGFEDSLVKLLQELDTIESGGDARVRDARRALVKGIEVELKKIDEGVRMAWKTAIEAVQPRTELELESNAMEVENIQSDPVAMPAEPVEVGDTCNFVESSDSVSTTDLFPAEEEDSTISAPSPDSMEVESIIVTEEPQEHPDTLPTSESNNSIFLDTSSSDIALLESMKDSTLDTSANQRSVETKSENLTSLASIVESTVSSASGGDSIGMSIQKPTAETYQQAMVDATLTTTSSDIVSPHFESEQVDTQMKTPPGSSETSSTPQLLPEQIKEPAPAHATPQSHSTFVAVASHDPHVPTVVVDPPVDTTVRFGRRYRDLDEDEEDGEDMLKTDYDDDDVDDADVVVVGESSKHNETPNTESETDFVMI